MTRARPYANAGLPPSRQVRLRRLSAIALLILAAGAEPASAYIGPGAGFALVSSGLVLLTTIVTVLLTVVAWPFRIVWRALTRPRAGKARIARLVVVGFDGQDPALTDRFMREGLLPNFSALAAEGSYRRLATTCPALSPVAWSSFSTGVQPGRHNIFDFLDRDRRTYLPLLSSTRIGPVVKALRLGRFRLPLRRPELRLLRKSKPFWTILGEHRIWSTVLRVPITFPPDRFYGAELSAMCVPDLRGTQGTFTQYTTRPAGAAFQEGGLRQPLTLDGDRFETTLEGPEHPFRDDRQVLRVPLTGRLDRARREAHLELGGTQVTLAAGVLSDWIPLAFPALPGVATIKGLARLMVTEMDEHFSLYVSPINMDPDRPAMPISHPPYYAAYLAKKVGAFATLGLAEDTWALNEGVTDDQTFLRQAYDIDAERERMFFASLDRLRRGSLVCVFDATDRIQHMFWRDIDGDHPARRDGTRKPTDAIRDLYRHNDALVGRVRARLGKDDVLMVISDHGFSTFRRGVNLNQWLLREGYLRLKPGADGTAAWLRDVDWSATRAYALGLTGLYLNLHGREAHGIVQPGAEAAALKSEIAGKLRGLKDDAHDAVAINEAFDTAVIYDGPYLENAPDFILGFNAGYRTSWDGASGVVAGPVFDDNRKPWSGDHCIDPRLVPGVFFCNRATTTPEPSLMDIAPTALRLFGIEPPAYMEGRPLEGLA